MMGTVITRRKVWLFIRLIMADVIPSMMAVTGLVVGYAVVWNVQGQPETNVPLFHASGVGAAAGLALWTVGRAVVLCITRDRVRESVLFWDGLDCDTQDEVLVLLRRLGSCETGEEVADVTNVDMGPNSARALAGLAAISVGRMKSDWGR